jgi:antitoxin VapB
MSINIKNERVSTLANELAEATGETITDAVGHAIEARLAEVRKLGSRKGIADKLLALSRKCVQEAPLEWRSWDYDADLYDDRGMPR